MSSSLKISIIYLASVPVFLMFLFAIMSQALALLFIKIFIEELMENQFQQQITISKQFSSLISFQLQSEMQKYPQYLQILNGFFYKIVNDKVILNKNYQSLLFNQISIYQNEIDPEIVQLQSQNPVFINSWSSGNITKLSDLGKYQHQLIYNSSFLDPLLHSFLYENNKDDQIRKLKFDHCSIGSSYGSVYSTNFNYSSYFFNQKSCRPDYYQTDSRCRSWYQGMVNRTSFFLETPSVNQGDISPYLSQPACQRTLTYNGITGQNDLLRVNCLEIRLIQLQQFFQNFVQSTKQLYVIDPRSGSVIFNQNEDEADSLIKKLQLFTLKQIEFDHLESQEDADYFQNVIHSNYNRWVYKNYSNIQLDEIVDFNYQQIQFYYDRNGTNCSVIINPIIIIDKLRPEYEGTDPPQNNNIFQANIAILQINILTDQELVDKISSINKYSVNVSTAIGGYLVGLGLLSIGVTIYYSLKIAFLILQPIEHITQILQKISTEAKNNDIYSILSEYEIDIDEIFLSQETSALYESFQQVFQMLLFTTDTFFHTNQSETLLRLHRNIEFFKQFGNNYAVGITHNNIGNLLFNQGHYFEALEHYSSSVIYARYEIQEYYNKNQMELQQDQDSFYYENFIENDILFYHHFPIKRVESIVNDQPNNLNNTAEIKAECIKSDTLKSDQQETQQNDEDAANLSQKINFKLILPNRLTDQQLNSKTYNLPTIQNNPSNTSNGDNIPNFLSPSLRYTTHSNSVIKHQQQYSLNNPVKKGSYFSTAANRKTQDTSVATGTIVTMKKAINLPSSQSNQQFRNLNLKMEGSSKTSNDLSLAFSLNQKRKQKEEQIELLKNLYFRKQNYIYTLTAFQENLESSKTYDKLYNFWPEINKLLNQLLLILQNLPFAKYQEVIILGQIAKSHFMQQEYEQAEKIFVTCEKLIKNFNYEDDLKERFQYSEGQTLKEDSLTQNEIAPQNNKTINFTNINSYNNIIKENSKSNSHRHNTQNLKEQNINVRKKSLFDKKNFAMRKAHKKATFSKSKSLTPSKAARVQQSQLKETQPNNHDVFDYSQEQFSKVRESSQQNSNVNSPIIRQHSKSSYRPFSAAMQEVQKQIKFQEFPGEDQQLSRHALTLQIRRQSISSPIKKYVKHASRSVPKHTENEDKFFRLKSNTVHQNSKAEDISKGVNVNPTQNLRGYIINQLNLSDDDEKDIDDFQTLFFESKNSDALSTTKFSLKQIERFHQKIKCYHRVQLNFNKAEYFIQRQRYLEAAELLTSILEQNENILSHFPFKIIHQLKKILDECSLSNKKEELIEMERKYNPNIEIQAMVIIDDYNNQNENCFYSVSLLSNIIANILTKPKDALSICFIQGENYEQFMNLTNILTIKHVLAVILESLLAKLTNIQFQNFSQLSLLVSKFHEIEEEEPTTNSLSNNKQADSKSDINTSLLSISTHSKINYEEQDVGDRISHFIRKYFINIKDQKQKENSDGKQHQSNLNQQSNTSQYNQTKDYSKSNSALVPYSRINLTKQVQHNDGDAKETSQFPIVSSYELDMQQAINDQSEMTSFNETAILNLKQIKELSPQNTREIIINNASRPLLLSPSNDNTLIGKVQKIVKKKGFITSTDQQENKINGSVSSNNIQFNFNNFQIQLSPPPINPPKKNQQQNHHKNNKINSLRQNKQTNKEEQYENHLLNYQLSASVVSETSLAASSPKNVVAQRNLLFHLSIRKQLLTIKSNEHYSSYINIVHNNQKYIDNYFNPSSRLHYPQNMLGQQLFQKFLSSSISRIIIYVTDDIVIQNNKLFEELCSLLHLYKVELIIGASKKGTNFLETQPNLTYTFKEREIIRVFHSNQKLMQFLKTKRNLFYSYKYTTFMQHF